MKLFVICVLLIQVTAISARAQSSATSEQDCQTEKLKIARYEKQLSDWAQLKRYEEANRKVQPLTGSEKRVVFIGDSITDGWNLAEFFPGKPYFNRGISGQTTPQMLIRFRPDVIALKPQVVVILAGTNDIAGNTGLMTLEDTASNIASMAELARANRISVVLSSVLPVNDRVRNKEGKLFVQTTRRPNEKIAVMNKWIKKYAGENNFVYLDYHAASVNENGMLKDGISYDGLHPNAEGYKVMQPLAEKAIEMALKKRE